MNDNSKQSQSTDAPDLKVNADAAHPGAGHSAPYPVSRLAPSFDLVDTARQIADADASIASHTEARLRLIADQVKSLQEEAKRILQQADRDAQLHRAQCSFQMIPGKVYHLYRKADGERVWSMLSPRDWGGQSPQTFAGSYKLEVDRSWTEIDEEELP